MSNSNTIVYTGHTYFQCAIFLNATTQNSGVLNATTQNSGFLNAKKVEI